MEGALGNGCWPRVTFLCHFPETWAGFPAPQWNVAPQVVGQAADTCWASLQGQHCSVTSGPLPLAASRPARPRDRLLSAQAPSQQPGCAGGLVPGCTQGWNESQPNSARLIRKRRKRVETSPRALPVPLNKKETMLLREPSRAERLEMPCGELGGLGTGRGVVGIRRRVLQPPEPAFLPQPGCWLGLRQPD